MQASLLLYELRQAEFTNLLYFTQGRSLTNDLAEQTELRFKQSQAMAEYYNQGLSHGKWNGFQTQPYIGYGDVARYGADAAWQQPQIDNEAIADAIYPGVKHNTPRAGKIMGVAIDGSDRVWPDAPISATLPRFSRFQRQPAQYIEVFNRGNTAFAYSIKSPVPWLSATPSSGQLDKQVRCLVAVDWTKAPRGTTHVPLTVSGPNGSKVTVEAIVENPNVVATELKGFVESNGYVSMHAEHYARAIDAAPITWKLLTDIGRTSSGMTPFPPTAKSQTPGGNGPHLEYDLYLFTAGTVQVWAYLSPRNNVLHGEGIRHAVSLDDEPPQVVNTDQATGALPMNRSWGRNTADNVTRTATAHIVSRAGQHVLKFWMVDPTVILQQLVVDTGGLKPSYLGPPESFNNALDSGDKAQN